MKLLMDGTEMRRKKQIAYNKEHGIVPQTIQKGRMQTIEEAINAGKPPKNSRKMPKLAENMFTDGEVDFQKMGLTEAETQALVEELTREMLAAAEALEFERAAELRDNLRALKG